MSEYTLISNEVLKFLNGEGPLEGRHFGEHYYNLPLYWWRKRLPKVGEVDAEIQRLQALLEQRRETSDPQQLLVMG